MNKSTSVVTQPPNIKEMIRMVFGLSLVCLVAASILGGIYLWTAPLKEKNQSAREEQMLRSLLDLPATAKVAEIRRYITQDLKTVYLTEKNLIITNDQGKVVQRVPAPVPATTTIIESKQESSTSEFAMKPEDKDKWVLEQIPQSSFAGRFFLAYAAPGEIGGYIIEGLTNGYKAKVRFFIALGKDMKIHAVEILEQEEDPGLGGEISQNYFKNQFAGRTAEDLQELEVKKEPLPLDWKNSLEELGHIPFSQWEKQNETQLVTHKKIYAITGATISSDAINQATKKAVSNFKKRLAILAGDL